jgi:hypothetical protein
VINYRVECWSVFFRASYEKMIGEGVEGRGRGLNFREGRKKEHEKPIFLCPAPPEYQVGVLTT